MTQIHSSGAAHAPIQASPRRRPASRQPAVMLLSLGLGLILVVLAVQHVHYQYRFETLQHQLVATQDSFAGLGEESMRRLVVGFAHELEQLQQTLATQQRQLVALDRLRHQQQGQDQQLSGLSGRLDTQAEAVEKGLLLLDSAQQKLESQLDDHRQQGEAAVQQQQAVLESLQQQQQADKQRLDELTAALMGKDEQNERHQQLQQSVLKLAQQVTADRRQQEAFGRELAAFRLQVTRAQDRLQQRLDALTRGD